MSKDIIASSAQMGAIMHGIGAKPKWEWYEPATEVEVPSWVRGVHIEWMDGYANRPGWKLLVDDGVHTWREQYWRFIPPEKSDANGYYITEHADGRAKCHYHGPLKFTEKFTRHVKIGPAQWYEATQALRTTRKSEGYGGSHFYITMHPDEGGDVVVLRGPWHGCPPMGYQEFTTVELSDSKPFKKGDPWHNRGGCFGLMVKTEVLAAIAKKFVPELKLAMVHESWGDFLEPTKPDWTAPKNYLGKE